MDFHCKVRLRKKNQRDSKSMEGKSIKQIHLAAAHMSQLLLCVSNSNLRNHPCFVTSSARSLKDKEDIIPTNLKHLFQKRGTQHLMAFDWSCWVLPPRLPINSWGFNFFHQMPEAARRIICRGASCVAQHLVGGTTVKMGHRL